MGQCSAKSKKEQINQNEVEGSKEKKKVGNNKKQGIILSQSVNCANYSKKKKYDKSNTVQVSDLVGEKKALFDSVYTVIKQLGKGSFGEVQKVEHKITQKQFAAKVIQKKFIQPNETEEILKEIQILKELDHPNIIRIYEYFNEPKYIYIIMEYCEGGELFSKNFVINDQNIAFIAKKLLQAINYCHQNNIAHRDIKPDNILYINLNENSDIKLVDWGLSCFFKDDERFNRVIGTPLYMAPELLQRTFTPKSDLWAIGLLLYMLVTQKHPFTEGTKSMKDLLVKIVEGNIKYPAEKFQKVSQECKEFIISLLQIDPNDRPSAQDLLKNEWLQTFQKIEELQYSSTTTESLKQLSTFSTQNKFQKTTWVYFSTYFATQKQMEEIRNSFNLLDENHDGVLSPEEIRSGLAKYLNFADADNFDNLIEEMDSNQNGKIDYNEFVQAAINREQLLCTDNIKKAFELVDTDGSGTISLDEFKMLFCGSIISEDVWEEMFKEADENGDNQISMEEFTKNLTSMLNSIQN